jgi:hypothetical protein
MSEKSYCTVLDKLVASKEYSELSKHLAEACLTSLLGSGRGITFFVPKGQALKDMISLAKNAEKFKQQVRVHVVRRGFSPEELKQKDGDFIISNNRAKLDVKVSGSKIVVNNCEAVLNKSLSVDRSFVYEVDDLFKAAPGSAPEKKGGRVMHHGGRIMDGGAMNADPEYDYSDEEMHGGNRIINYISTNPRQVVLDTYIARSGGLFNVAVSRLYNDFMGYLKVYQPAVISQNAYLVTKNPLLGVYTWLQPQVTRAIEYTVSPSLIDGFRTSNYFLAHNTALVDVGVMKTSWFGGSDKHSDGSTVGGVGPSITLTPVWRFMNVAHAALVRRQLFGVNMLIPDIIDANVYKYVQLGWPYNTALTLGTFKANNLAIRAIVKSTHPLLWPVANTIITQYFDSDAAENMKRLHKAVQDGSLVPIFVEMAKSVEKLFGLTKKKLEEGKEFKGYTT